MKFHCFSLLFLPQLLRKLYYPKCIYIFSFVYDFLLLFSGNFPERPRFGIQAAVTGTAMGDSLHLFNNEEYSHEQKEFLQPFSPGSSGCVDGQDHHVGQIQETI